MNPNDTIGWGDDYGEDYGGTDFYLLLLTSQYQVTKDNNE